MKTLHPKITGSECSFGHNYEHNAIEKLPYVDGFTGKRRLEHNYDPKTFEESPCVNTSTSSMRLLNVYNLKFHNFQDQEVPPYAIASHY